MITFDVLAEKMRATAPLLQIDLDNTFRLCRAALTQDNCGFTLLLGQNKIPVLDRA